MAAARSAFQAGPAPRRRTWRLLLLVGLGIGLAACEQHIDIASAADQARESQAFAPWTDLPAPHRLVAGDDIDLKFLINPELNDRVTIGPDGRVTVPLLGAVDAQGQTVAEFTKSLETAYAPKLRVPALDVIVRGYGAARIYVGGEVKAPGVLAMNGQMDVLQGVLAAGGTLPTATLAKVVVIRRRADHTPMMRTVDLRQAIGHPGSAADFPLQAADVVYVPKSNIAEFDLFIDQYLNQALPFQKNITANLGNGYF